MQLPPAGTRTQQQLLPLTHPHAAAAPTRTQRRRRRTPAVSAPRPAPRALRPGRARLPPHPLRPGRPGRAGPGCSGPCPGRSGRVRTPHEARCPGRVRTPLPRPLRTCWRTDLLRRCRQRPRRGAALPVCHSDAPRAASTAQSPLRRQPTQVEFELALLNLGLVWDAGGEAVAPSMEIRRRHSTPVMVGLAVVPVWSYFRYYGGFG